MEHFLFVFVLSLFVDVRNILIEVEMYEYITHTNA